MRFLVRYNLFSSYIHIKNGRSIPQLPIKPYLTHRLDSQDVKKYMSVPFVPLDNDILHIIQMWSDINTFESSIYNGSEPASSNRNAAFLKLPHYSWLSPKRETELTNQFIRCSQLQLHYTLPVMLGSLLCS